MRCTSEHPQLLTATHRTTPTKAAPRGYALIMCMIFGVLLASLTAAMLWSAGRDTAEARVQENAVRALYAAEAAAATGIEQLRLRMVTTPTPVITGITAPTLPGVQFPVFLINYIDSQTLAVKATPDTKLSLIENGPNSGLVAQQTPIQVLVSADVGGSRATISNAINAQQIPVFQFALFYNGDMELLNPGDFTVKGRVHANGDIHIAAPPRGLSVRFETTGMSSGTGHLFRCSIHNPTAFCTSKGGQPASDVRIFDGIQPIATPGTWPTLEKGFEDNLTETAQRDYLTANFKGVVVDKSILTHPIRVPIQLPASTVLPTIASRPDFCPGNDPETSATGVSAAFPQSAEAVIVKRPVGAYGSGNYPAGNPLAAWDSNYGPVPGLGSGTAAPCV